MIREADKTKSVNTITKGFKHIMTASDSTSGLHSAKDSNLPSSFFLKVD